MSMAQMPRMTGGRGGSCGGMASEWEAMEEREEDLVRMELERGEGWSELPRKADMRDARCCMIGSSAFFPRPFSMSYNAAQPR